MPLEVELAGPGTRSAAALIDAGVMLAAVIAVSIPLAILGMLPYVGEPAKYVLGLLLGGVFLVPVLYHVLFALLNGGRTPGKVALGLAVRSDLGWPAGRAALVLRAVCLLVDMLPLPIPLGISAAALSPRAQRIGDLAARTVVVREARGVRPEPLPGERWSTRVDTTRGLTLALGARLDRDDLAHLRALLERAELRPEEQKDLLEAAAHLYAERLGVEPPRDPGPFLVEVFLLARENLLQRQRPDASREFARERSSAGAIQAPPRPSWPAASPAPASDRARSGPR